MSIKEYTRMNSRDWLNMATRAARAYAQSNKSGDDNTTGSGICTGTVSVGTYTRADGTQVSGYERSCPYHNGNNTANDSEPQKQTSDGFVLSHNFSSNSPVDTFDVINLKVHLSKMNYYKAEPRSEPDNKFHGYPNDGLIDAIKQFQRDNGITPDGIILKGGKTEAAINSKFTSHGTRFNFPVNTNAAQVAVFDGKSLTLFLKNKPIVSWDAVSGKKGYQSPLYQSKKDTGPIPAGTYVARQSELQFMTIKDAAIGTSRLIKDKWGGKWPGSYYSWGNSRVWLEPAKSTNTFGRDRFSIHGGMVPGSAGCIDMTKHIGAFTSWMENSGKDLIVIVDYK